MTGRERMTMTDDDAARLRAAITRLARKLNSSSTGEDLSPSEASVLATVTSRGPVGLAELTAFEEINPTMASRIVTVLSRRHLIKRIRNPQDRRAVLLEATPAGGELWARIMIQRREVIARTLGALPTKDREAIVRSLPALELLVRALGGTFAGGDRPPH
jgi:DNA-binding MarR family transcriptional regulator